MKLKRMSNGNVTPTKTRRLKVYYGHHGNSYQRHPVIRLGGKYLSLLDFKIGDMIEIKMERDSILITKLPRAENKSSA